MPTPARSPLIDVDELRRRLAAEDHHLVVLDVRWSLAGADENAYREAHIPGALFVDLDTELAGAPGIGGRHPLPEPAELEHLWCELGLDDRTEVVVYDAADSSIAARCWWLLRWSGRTSVQVLDGGFAAWRRSAGPLETGTGERPGGGTVRVRPGGLPTAGIDEVALAGHPGEPIVLDARAPPRYRGEVEPIDPVAGHIPGAVNLPFANLVHPDGTFRPVPELARLFEQAGIGAETAAIASCGSGVTACHLVLAGELTGRRVALFPASYSGWCAAGRPVETG